MVPTSLFFFLYSAPVVFTYNEMTTHPLAQRWAALAKQIAQIVAETVELIWFGAPPALFWTRISVFVR
jgi:hypothetical protein